MQSCFTEKQRRILSSRFGLEQKTRTLRDLAEEYRISPESVRSIERRALRKIELRHLSVVKRADFPFPSSKLSAIEKKILTVLWGIEDGIWRDYLVAASACSTTVDVVLAVERKAIGTKNKF